MNQKHIWRRVRFAIDLALHGDLGRIATILRRKTWSTSRAIGLIRDLDVPFQTPDTRSPVSFRLMREDDVPKLLDLSSAALSIEERRDRIDRLHLLRSGFDTCFVVVVVVDEHDHPCSMEWMIRSHENALLQTAFGGLFRPLSPDEVLLEGAYTSSEFRGQRMMPYAMCGMAAVAKKAGARHAVTFVGHDNTASLRGCERAGFAPYMLRADRWRFFRRRVTFIDLPAEQSG